MERRHQWTLLGGLGIGAGLMYLLDPERGRRRRAAAQGKAAHSLRAGGAALGRASRDLIHRGKGLFAEAGARLPLHREQVEDRVLEDRVRSKMGRYVSHSHAIEVLAEDGEVTLAGEILQSEAAGLLAAVRSVRGVRKVDDQLRIHESAEHVSSLQGEPRKNAHRNSRPWPPAKRLLATTAGGALAYAGFHRRDPIGIVIGAVGIGLIARGLTASGPQTLDISKTILVGAPIEDVFGYWAEFENFPRFMANVLEVERTGPNCWHWVVRGPAGTHLEWDACLSVFEPERVLSWKTLPGADLGNAGSVHFTPTGEMETRVDVRVSIHPPAGALGSIGHAIATLLGRDPETEMDEDLARFKALMEEGRTTVEGETVLRGDIPAGPVEPIRLH
ncbi:MAG TPA: SRPBCC family protein [Thermoanaerobaculia bacterium]|nr:SRPBCC family protein [Thermoanaerobaculia bacterium]